MIHQFHISHTFPIQKSVAQLQRYWNADSHLLYILISYRYTYSIVIPAEDRMCYRHIINCPVCISFIFFYPHDYKFQSHNL